MKVIDGKFKDNSSKEKTIEMLEEYVSYVKEAYEKGLEPKVVLFSEDELGFMVASNASLNDGYVIASIGLESLMGVIMGGPQDGTVH